MFNSSTVIFCWSYSYLVVKCCILLKLTNTSQLVKSKHLGNKHWHEHAKQGGDWPRCAVICSPSMCECTCEWLPLLMTLPPVWMCECAWTQKLRTLKGKFNLNLRGAWRSGRTWNENMLVLHCGGVDGVHQRTCLNLPWHSRYVL